MEKAAQEQPHPSSRFYAWKDEPRNRKAVRRWQEKWDAKEEYRNSLGHGAAYSCDPNKSPTQRFCFFFMQAFASRLEERRATKVPDNQTPAQVSLDFLLTAYQALEPLLEAAVADADERERKVSQYGETDWLEHLTEEQFPRLLLEIVDYWKLHSPQAPCQEGRRRLIRHFNELWLELGSLPNKAELEFRVYGRDSESNSQQRNTFNAALVEVGLDGLPKRPEKKRKRGHRVS